MDREHVTDTAMGPGIDRSGSGPEGRGAAGRIARGMGANAWGVVVTLTIQVISVPVLLGAWGVQVYGEWLILSVFSTYVAHGD